MKQYRFFLYILCMLIANTMFAESSERSLVVLMNSGTQIILPIIEQPRILFDGTIMHVGNDDYQIENVRKWMIGDPDEIANTIENMKRENPIVYKNGILNVGSRIDVRAYNAAGVEMPVQIRNGQVDMSAWPQDVYVIKAGTETLKLRKR